MVNLKNPKHRSTFVYKVLFRSTSLLIKVLGTSEEDAFARAVKRKDVKGCDSLKLIEERSV